MLAMISNAFLDKIKHRSYRAGYIEEHAKTHVAYQVRTLREERKWTQKEFADVMGKPPSVVSRIEDPDYGKLSMQTLFEIAAAFDVAMVIDYVSFPEFVSRKENVSPSALSVPSFDEDQFLSVEDLPRDHVWTQAAGSFSFALIDPPSPVVLSITGAA